MPSRHLVGAESHGSNTSVSLLLLLLIQQVLYARGELPLNRTALHTCMHRSRSIARKGLRRPTTDSWRVQQLRWQVGCWTSRGDVLCCVVLADLRVPALAPTRQRGAYMVPMVPTSTCVRALLVVEFSIAPKNVFSLPFLCLNCAEPNRLEPSQAEPNQA